ncbi:MAG: outer membrane protein OmpA-like peptidoglycan-associated protein [Flavobacterium sp.]|jgi:outer membrane protein OmpA-like peptidoglycan-associated protein/tetratricopeptide (TPR) repeat protein
MKKKTLYLLFFALITLQISAQKVQIAQADKDFEQYDYVDAIKTYERIFEKGYKSTNMLQKLGDSYYFKAELENAAKWYTELFALTQDVAPEYYYRYSQTLKAIKDYKKADQMLLKFNQISGNDTRAKLAISQKDYLAEIKKNSGRYVIENASINSKYSDYGSSYYKEKVVFTSARDTGSLASRKHNWTGESFTNLYAADMAADGSLSNAKRFAKKINTKFHEATPVFTSDGKTVYFTRNNYTDGKEGKDDKRSTLLKIYQATLDGNDWKEVKELPFNSDQYSTAHPALSADNKTMYFASNMPGTLGQSDLFKVSINPDRTFGTPINLGNTINTEGRETFPMMTKNNELYFASDGHPGLGGLDVFVSKLNENGAFTEVLNVGEPLNSSKDDFGFLINTANKTGYVTSKRDGGEGNDDIYRFKETKAIEYGYEQLLTGIVTNQATGIAIKNARITLFDRNYQLIKEVRTDKEGNFDFGKVNCATKYYIKAEAETFNTTENPTITGKETGNTFVPIELEKTLQPVKVGDDLRKAFKIDVIYFDLDKSFIRGDAALELAKILDVLEQNPTMELDIRSHTDSRQTFKYNKALSDRRAKSTMQWLVSKGISKKRITAKGYGETQLVNKCADSVDCSEAEHQANRRSEFIITKI